MYTPPSCCVFGQSLPWLRPPCSVSLVSLRLGFASLVLCLRPVFALLWFPCAMSLVSFRLRFASLVLCLEEGCEWSGHSRQKGKRAERKKEGRKGETWWDSNRGAWVYRRGTIFSNKSFKISGDKVLETKRAKPRTPISMLRERDTDTLARVDNI